MDVEAQEEGVLAKIIVPDGTHNVNVGKIIAILAEQGDHISTLELVSQDGQAVPPPTPPKEGIESIRTEEYQNQESLDHKQRLHFAEIYSPAVLHVLQQYGIEDPKSIPATGPRGRLLKGDVLAHIGSIKPDVPKTLRDFLARKQMLDLSKIQVRRRESAPSPRSQPSAATKQLLPPMVSTIVDLSILLHVKPDFNRSAPYSLYLTLRSTGHEEISRFCDREGLRPCVGRPTCISTPQEVRGGHNIC